DAPARVAHVGIAVPSIAAALPFYRDILGVAPGTPETADGATIVSLPLGDVRVELLEPLQADGPVAQFLARRGPGIHHICYRVPASQSDRRHPARADGVGNAPAQGAVPRPGAPHPTAGLGRLSRCTS